MWPIRSAVSLPPLPWPSTMCLWSKIGMGQVKAARFSPAIASSVFRSSSAAAMRVFSLPRGVKAEVGRGGSGDDLMERVGSLRIQMAAVGVVRCACSLSRDHGRTERMLRIAKRPEGSTVVRPFDSTKNLAADAYLGFERGDLRDLVELFGVVTRELVTQMISTLRDGSDAAPLAVSDLEYLADQLLSGQIALAIQYA